MDSKNNVLMKPLSNAQQRFQAPPGGGGLGISSDGDDRMEPKVKTQKNP